MAPEKLEMEMLCPLLTLIQGMPTECRFEECMWWDCEPVNLEDGTQVTACCSVVSIAMSLRKQATSESTWNCTTLVRKA